MELSGEARGRRSQRRSAPGAVCLSPEGCGYSTWLVVTGAERGNLWSDARCVDEPLAPLWHRRRDRTGFADWYLEWLDALLRPDHRVRGKLR